MSGESETTITCDTCGARKWIQHQLGDISFCADCWIDFRRGEWKGVGSKKPCTCTEALMTGVNLHLKCPAHNRTSGEVPNGTINVNTAYLHVIRLIHARIEDLRKSMKDSNAQALTERVRGLENVVIELSLLVHGEEKQLERAQAKLPEWKNENVSADCEWSKLPLDVPRSLKHTLTNCPYCRELVIDRAVVATVYMLPSASNDERMRYAIQLTRGRIDPARIQAALERAVERK